MRHLVSRLLLIVLCFGLFVPRSEAAWSSNKRRAVVLEAFYALRPSHDGSCDRTIPSPTGEGSGNCISTWNYLASDTYAYNLIRGWYGCNASIWALPGDGSGCGGSYPFSFYNNVYGYGYSNGPYGFVGRGGQCKFFADLVLYRSGAQKLRNDEPHALPRYEEMWANSTTELHTAREGDVLIKFNSPGFDHTAIVVEVKRTNGVVTGLDVIDSNFVSDSFPTSGREVIGRHLFKLWQIQNVYRIWKGPDYSETQYEP